MLKYFLIEEYRRHTTIARKFSLFIFPLYILLFTAVGGVFIGDILKIFPYTKLVSMVMLSSFIYGLGVGSFEFLGKAREGDTLLTVSSILPLKIRKVYFFMFLRDAIYYTILFIIPTYAGLIISTYFSTLSLPQVSLLIISILLSMFIGYSLSYALFPIAQRNIRMYMIFLIILAGYIISVYTLDIPFPLSEFQKTKSVHWAIISIVLIFLFTVIGYALTTEAKEGGAKNYRYSLPRYERVFKNILLSKDMEDAVRAAIFIKASMTYFVPMVLLFIFVRVVNLSSGKIVYNTMSVSIMLSIFSTVVYSWLTVMDDTAYMAVLPLSTWDLIKAHMKTHLLIITVLSLPVILYFGSASSLFLIIPATGLFYLNAIYLLSLTVYLAGHRITSLLFDPEIVMKFSFYSILPGMTLIILTLDGGAVNYIATIIIAMIMIAISAIILLKAKNKWIYFT